MNAPGEMTERALLWLRVLLIAFLLFMGLMAVTYAPAPKNAKSRTVTTSAELQRLRFEVDTYVKEVGQAPPKPMGLNALVGRPPEGERKWFRQDPPPPDGWGRPYQYRTPHPDTPDDPKSYDLFSLGPDGFPSGDDVR